VPIRGALRDVRCLFCHLPGSESAQSANGAGTSAEVRIGAGAEGAFGPNVENPARVRTAPGQVANKDMPTMAKLSEPRKVRVRVPARSAALPSAEGVRHAG
jgi:hypothetical protein